MTNIDETLKKITAATSKASSANLSNTEPASSMLGDPNCPICHGVGWIRQDLPTSDPDFGKLKLCTCRQKQAAAYSQQRLFQLSNLEAFQGMTFENFKVQGRMGLSEVEVNSLNLALNQASMYARQLNGWILFTGGYGCGKTHLAAAIANQAVNLGVPTLFLTVPDLLDWLRFAYDSPEATFEQRFNEIRNIRLLVLDDLGTQNTTPWAAEKLYQVINYRYVNRLATVVTTNQSLEEIDGRVRSRLVDSDVVTLVRVNAPDYRDTLRDTSHPPLSTLHLHTGRTFGNFSVRGSEKLDPEAQRSLEKAYRAAQAFAEKPHGWLVLMGKYGTGKTHLAAAIGNYCHAKGETPMFVVVPDLLDHLRATFSPSSNVSYDELFNQVRTSQQLILDDLGTQSATPWAREKLYQIFNYRYNAELPTVITTAQAIDEIDPRIQSRMLDGRICTLYAILVPPFRGSAAPEKPRRAPRRAGS